MQLYSFSPNVSYYLSTQWNSLQKKSALELKYWKLCSEQLIRENVQETVDNIQTVDIRLLQSVQTRTSLWNKHNT